MDREIRYGQLDALRGIAALTVVFSHFSLLAPLIGLRHTPLRVLCGGHEAVILFFVLSGFVLTLQIKGAHGLHYGEYALRRICRIYLPYSGAILVTYVCYRLANAGAINWAGPWFNAGWQSSLSEIDLVRHLLFVLPFTTDQLDPVVWSLVYEMRISLIFPLIVLAVYHFPTWRSLFGAAVLSLAVCIYAVGARHYVLPASVSAEWLPTVHYALMFVVGAALAKHRGDISARLSRAPAASGVAAILLVGSLSLYFAARLLSFVASGVLSDYLFDWILTFAVSGMIACAISIAPLARRLQMAPLAFLGKISYSLYLFHAIVLFSVVHLAGARLGPTVSLILAAVLIIPVSYLGYLCLERPGIHLGRLIGRRISVRRVPADAIVRN